MKYFYILFLVALSASVNAEEYTSASNLKVTSVYVGYEEKGAFFDVDGDAVNPATCSGAPIAVDPNRSDVGHAVSVLLYAHATGKSVDLQLYNESCISGHRVLRRVKVKD